MARAGKVVLNGLLSGGVYLAVQAVDRRFTRNNVDDQLLLGGIAPLTTSHARALGTCIHLVNSVAISAIFATLAAPRLSGPAWWRGVVFATLENVLLYWLVLFEGFHPAIRDGRLDSYRSRTAFMQGVWRHLWFGAALGFLNRSTR